MAAEVCRGLRESVWLERGKYQQAEAKYHEVLAQRHSGLTVEVSDVWPYSRLC